MNASIQQSDTGDDAMNAAQREMGLRIASYRNNDPRLTRRTVREMQEIIDDYRQTCKRNGVILPKLRITAFVEMNHICIWPAELSQEEIQKRLRMFVIHRQRHNLPVIAEDMARGVRRAYPDYSPSRSNLVCPDTVKAN